MSEPFHLYVHDVLHDPMNSERAFVKIYHPALGLAPDDWFGANGKPIRCLRDNYLRNKYTMLPRTEYPNSHQLFAGWKGNLLDSKTRYMDVNWFPLWAGELFWKLWVFYMAQRMEIRCDHPFAFGLVASKSLGTSPHGHRHAYGQRLTDFDLDPIFRKKALHHKSLESQVVYTEPDRVKLTRELEAAEKRAASGETLSKLSPPDFIDYGFKDVDPIGLLSGSNPKLKRK